MRTTAPLRCATDEDQADVFEAAQHFLEVTKICERCVHVIPPPWPSLLSRCNLAPCDCPEAYACCYVERVDALACGREARRFAPVQGGTA